MPASAGLGFDHRIVAEHCRKGIAHIVLLARRCLKLKAAEKERTFKSKDSSISQLRSCLSLIDQHNAVYDTFLHSCFENFGTCPRDVKISIGQLLLLPSLYAATGTDDASKSF